MKGHEDLKREMPQNERDATLGAVILAGGQSRRMGQNKALLRPHPAAPRLIESVLQAVSPLADPILLSTNTPEIYAWLGLPTVADHSPGAGPLAGLEAALTAMPRVWVLLLACDMPCLAPDLLRFLADQRDTDQDAVIPRDTAGQLQPLCALYRSTCLPIIRQALADGQRQMTGWLGAVRTHVVAAEELQQYDPDLRSFCNVNTPTDLEEM